MKALMFLFTCFALSVAIIALALAYRASKTTVVAQPQADNLTRVMHNCLTRADAVVNYTTTQEGVVNFSCVYAPRSSEIRFLSL